MTFTSDERDTRIPYRLGTDHYCVYEDDESYVRMGDMISFGYDTPFGGIDFSGELCSVRYDGSGFIDAASVYVFGEDRITIITRGIVPTAARRWSNENLREILPFCA